MRIFAYTPIQLSFVTASNRETWGIHAILLRANHRVGNPGLTPCASHLRMKGPLRDGQTGFLRSLASALEAHSPVCRRGRPGFFLAGDLFHLQRSAQRASARPFLAYPKEALPRSERKRKGESPREAPPGHCGSRRTPPPITQSSFPTHAELQARGSGRVLRFLGRSQLLFLARICAPDRLALPDLAAGSQSRRPSASLGSGNEHDV